ncbi:MAG: hypothetical protein K9J13_10735 [Saprospiraceae bacterium]|nr:hypothetical protein [Saprospiraceae bacterium]
MIIPILIFVVIIIIVGIFYVIKTNNPKARKTILYVIISIALLVLIAFMFIMIQFARGWGV